MQELWEAGDDGRASDLVRRPHIVATVGSVISERADLDELANWCSGPWERPSEAEELSSGGDPVNRQLRF